MGEVDINLVSVLVAALAGFVVGGLWYSPFLFANQWMLAANVTQEQVDGSNKGKVFGLTFVFLLIIAYCLAAFLAAPEVTVATGALYGFLTGFGWMFFACPEELPGAECALKSQIRMESAGSVPSEAPP